MSFTNRVRGALKKIPFFRPILQAFFTFWKRRWVRIELWRNDHSFSDLSISLAKLLRTFRPDDFSRIVFVKQEVLALLYCASSQSSPREVIFSTLKHTGPVGIFTKLKSSFLTLKTEDAAAECQTWKEVVSGSRISSVEELESLKYRPFRDGARGHIHAPGEFAVAADDVDWSRYDLVIGMDIAIPTRILRRFPGTVWAYCIAEPMGMPSYKKSHARPLAGYDLFLNQKFRLNPSGNRWHEIECPLNLHYYGCFHDLLGIAVDDSAKRTGIFVESHTANLLTKQQLNQLASLGDLKFVSPGTEDIVVDLLKCKYFIRHGGRSLLGNGMVEAIAAGCLVLGDASEFMNRSLFLTEHHLTTFSSLTQKIRQLNSDDAAYRATSVKQRILVDYLCFYRPLDEIRVKAFKIRKSRSK